MLTYQQAIKKILNHSKQVRPKQLPLRSCLGLATACDLVSLEPYPHFDNSAVDGYAIHSPSTRQSSLKVIGEIRAGETYKGRLAKGSAVRIFTGAPVPKGTQAVVMQEDTERVNGHVVLLKQPSLNENIRFRGEDFKKRKILVPKNTELTAAHLAVLAAVGYEKISAYPAPRVGILATGSELLKKGETLTAGKIRDCNSILLEGLVGCAGGAAHVFPLVGDDPNQIRRAIRKGLGSDVFIISGGVSVGAYDFVKDILREEGVQEIFWKVNIKPGKPVFFGMKNKTLVFGLPGNPVSVFVTFQEFVKPALLKMMGRNRAGEELLEGEMIAPFHNGSRLHFVRVHCQKENGSIRVRPLKGQGSHMIGSLADANGLIRVEPNTIVETGQKVLVEWIGGE